MCRRFISSEISTDSIVAQQDITDPGCVYIELESLETSSVLASAIFKKHEAAELGRYLIQLAEGENVK